MQVNGPFSGSNEYRTAQVEAAAVARLHGTRPWYRKLPYHALFSLGTVLVIGNGGIAALKPVLTTHTAAVTSHMASEAAAFIHPAVSSAAPAKVAETTETLPAERLALLSALCVEERALNKCSGSVKNVSDAPLHGVQVVVSWVDANGVAQNADTAAVAQDPLLPGQEVRWQTTGESSPALNNFRIAFREPATGRIPTRDDRAH